MHIANDSVDIGENVLLKFKGVFTTKGAYQSGKQWFALDLLFMDDEGCVLRRRLFDPRNEQDDWAFRNILNELITVVSGNTLSAENIPFERFDKEEAYTNLITLLLPYRDVRVFVKTCHKRHHIEKDKILADICEYNYISKEANLTYSVIEQNNFYKYKINIKN